MVLLVTAHRLACTHACVPLSCDSQADTLGTHAVRAHDGWRSSTNGAPRPDAFALEDGMRVYAESPIRRRNAHHQTYLCSLCLVFRSRQSPSQSRPWATSSTQRTRMANCRCVRCRLCRLRRGRRSWQPPHRDLQTLNAGDPPPVDVVGKAVPLGGRAAVPGWCRARSTHQRARMVRRIR